MAQFATINANRAFPGGHLRRYAACFFALVIVAIGIVGVVIPDTLIAQRTSVVSTASVYIEAALKVAIGITLALVARQSRAAGTLLLMGAALIVGGLAIPVFGVEGARQRLAWEAAHLTFFRFEAAFFVLLGIIILSIVMAKGNVNNRNVSTMDCN